MTSVNDRSYTRYQKDVIKAVSKLIGTTPFRHEKAQNNHLKLVIEGIDKPIYTSSTPSDRRSLQNLLSQVQQMLRIEIPEQIDPSITPPDGELFHVHACLYQKIKERLIRMFRNQVAELENKERVMINEQQSIDEVIPFRKQLVKQAITDKLKMHKSGGYFKTSEIRGLTKDLMHHLNFMLPDLATYAAQLKAANEAEPEAALEAGKEPQPEAESFMPEPKERARPYPVQNIHYAMKTQPQSKKRVKTVSRSVQSPAVKHQGATVSPLIAVSEKESTDMLSALLSLSSKARVSEFKTLTMAQANVLLAEIQQAIEEKHDDDLNEVIALIQSKGLALGEIAERMEGLHYGTKSVGKKSVRVA